MAEKIDLALTRFETPIAHTSFSARTVPLSADRARRPVCEAGDGNRTPGDGTRRLEKCAHCVTRAKWDAENGFRPPLTDTIEAWRFAGEKNLLVVPVAFVTEHIETLHEINIEARELGAQKGVQQFEMMPAVGDSPAFISALADLVRQAIRSSS